MALAVDRFLRLTTRARKRRFGDDDYTPTPKRPRHAGDPNMQEQENVQEADDYVDSFEKATRPFSDDNA